MDKKWDEFIQYIFENAESTDDSRARIFTYVPLDPEDKNWVPVPEEITIWYGDIESENELYIELYDLMDLVYSKKISGVKIEDRTVVDFEAGREGTGNRFSYFKYKRHCLFEYTSYSIGTGNWSDLTYLHLGDEHSLENFLTKKAINYTEHDELQYFIPGSLYIGPECDKELIQSKFEEKLGISSVQEIEFLNKVWHLAEEDLKERLNEPEWNELMLFKKNGAEYERYNLELLQSAYIKCLYDRRMLQK